MPGVAAIATITHSVVTDNWLVRRKDGMEEIWDDDSANDNRVRTVEDSRRFDLAKRHSADLMKNSFPQAERRDGWHMFRQEGCVVDGVWKHSWCVYPCNDKDPLYTVGLWFGNEAAAVACLQWKRAFRKPSLLTRLLRKLPWR